MFIISPRHYQIKNTKFKGRGVFAKLKIKKGTLIGEYKGNKLPYHKINPKTYEYLIYFNDKIGIVADKGIVGVHLLNHSCDPNCILVVNPNKIFVKSVKEINIHEELTISYNYLSQENCSDCSHKCYCRSENCSGSMHPSINKA